MSGQQECAGAATAPSSCLLVPIFEHGDSIGAVLRSLEPFGLDCIVVDDGSGPRTRAVLDALESELDRVEVVHRDRNGGRGAALKTGYRRAAQRGFDYALQLDADGQHAANDVPRFLDAIARSPGALVLGSPIFDASAPRARLWGRQISRATVWLATLSFDIVDPLCGFRAIPLAPMLELLDDWPTGDHMEFDPEIAIQLHRRGVPVVDVPTRVVYDPQGLSHFDMWRDNVRMSGMYARALLGAACGRARRRPRARPAGSE